MFNLLKSPKFNRIVTILFSSLVVLTTAQSCTLPGFTPTVNTTVYGIFKKGDSRSTSTNFIKINAVKQIDGSINVDGLKDISGLKLIQYDKNILYLLTQQRGLFRSDDGGYTWSRKYIFKVESTQSDQKARDTEISSEIARNNLIVPTDLAINAQNDKIIYVAAKDGNIGKVYQSTDGGENFREIYTEVAVNTGVTFVAVDPKNPLRVYGVLQGGSLIRSLDGGLTWQKIRSFKETPVQIGFVPQFNNLFYLLFPSQGLATSNDDGENWNNITLTKEPSSIGENQPKDGLDLTFSGNTKFGKFDKIVPASPNSSQAWLLLADKQIWYTTDTSKPVKKLVLPLQSEQQNLLDAAPDPKLGLEKILVSINDKLFESVNQGTSWSSSDKITQKIGNIGQILIDKEDTSVIYLMILETKYVRSGGLLG